MNVICYIVHFSEILKPHEKIVKINDFSRINNISHKYL